MSKPRLLDLFCGAGGCSRGYADAGFDVVGVDERPMPRYPYEFIQADALALDPAFLRTFDAIHASPPCQVHSALKHFATPGRHHDWIPQTRAMLRAAGRPYVIENVPGSPIRGFMLCGTMFALQTPCGAELRRHRLFETSFFVFGVPECSHSGGGVVPVYGHENRDARTAKADRLARTITVVGDQPRDCNTARGKSVIGLYGGHARDRTRTITVTGATPQQNVVRNRVRRTYTVDDARSAMGIDWMSMAGLSQAIPPAYTRWIGERLMAHLSQAAAA